MRLSRASKDPVAPPELPADRDLPRGMLIAGAWSWRVLAVAAVLGIVVLLVIQLRSIVVPLLISVLLASLLVPFTGWLRRHGWPKWLAIVVAELALLAALTALVYLVVTEVASGFGELRDRSVDAYEGFREWLLVSPFHITEADFDGAVDEIGAYVQANVEALISSALSVTSTIGGLATGFLLVIFITLFLLIDGRGVWGWCVRLLPRRARPAMAHAGERGWHTLVNFARAQVLVATIDAVGIALGAAVLGLPLAIPIGVLVFLGSFIPFLGAIVTGAFAVFVALVFAGLPQGIIMLVIVLAVQQLEGHVLQPLIMGTAVKVHPLGVVLAVTTGTLVAGVPGALFAVPLVATLNTMIKAVASQDWRRDAPPLPAPADRGKESLP